MIAADFANYARVPTPADIAALKALGVTRVIVGTSFSQKQVDGSYVYVATEQMAVCEAAGFEVQEYQFLGHLKPTARVWWLDIEEGETVFQIDTALKLVKPAGIYTRRGIWINNTGDWDIVSAYPGLKLWDANYGPLPRKFVPYGGWTAPAMTQYHDTMDIGTGFEVDLNIYTQEDDMAAVQLIWNPDFGRLYVLGQGDPRWIAGQAAAADLQRAYGLPTVALSWATLRALGAT